jgi:hypothetical protein
MKKIVVASDSFKGSLTSMQVASAVEQGIRKVYPECEVIKLSVADGGEGTMDALRATLGGRWVNAKVDDPLGRRMNSAYVILNDARTAVIEMSEASGLTLLRPEERNPMKTSTYGTGEMIADALSGGDEIGEVLFYFSGHGVQDNDMHYALCGTRVDAINSTTLNNAEVDAVVRKVSPKLFVKVIDACQSGLSYIKGLGETITEDMDLQAKDFENCIFLCSSRSTQSSYAGNPYSKFTKATLNSSTKSIPNRNGRSI